MNPFALIILDGFGFREETEHNAIAQANTPNWDKLWKQQPHMLIEGSGEGVGLPQGQMGNSEVGHLNLGAGRVVMQEFSRIESAISDGSFDENTVLVKAISDAIENNKKIHIIGLLSSGGVHSHENQLLALIKLAAEKGSQQIYLHAFLDGRDCPPKSAKASLQKAADLFSKQKCGKIASIIGRYYAMDRDNRWERTEAAFDLINFSKAEFHASDAITALNDAYARGETDEFVQATSIHEEEKSAITVDDGDCVIFMNYRADRARQLTKAFVLDEFDAFPRKAKPTLSHFVSLTQYEKGLPVEVAFPPFQPKNILGECVANAGLKQLRIAETEKYAHVTFFFNGGTEDAFENEERILIPSPNVATYDLQPQMNAELLTDQLVEAIESNDYQLIVCNFANADMVGHTGNLEATIKAIETLDHCLGRITKALDKVKGEAIITADHGNAEKMYNHSTCQAHTAHTTEPVPLVYYGKPAKMIAEQGALCDIAPTILSLMKLPIPKEMTGKILIRKP